ncbi:MAG: DUF4442 domain-containing protein [Acidobacteriota bacterium]|nr:DUF4442 domain-containing protein [Acidobacteriota bacterium]
MTGDPAGGSGNHRPRRLSERTGRWLLNLYPPFLCQRIRVSEIGPGFTRVTVRVSQSLLNRNLNGTIFGGTIYSAADPIYALMFWQVFAREGIATRVWLRRATVRFLEPASGKLTLRFELSAADLHEARSRLARDGRHVHTCETAVADGRGRTCAVIETEAQVALRTPPS